jgi:hypothetical protein
LSEQDARSPKDGFRVSQEDRGSTDRAALDPEFLKLLEAVWERIDREGLIHFTRNLVRVPGVFRPGDTEGNEVRAARLVADYLDGEGSEVRVE